MIDVTQKKLREARFFMHILGNANRQPVRNEPEEFEFYLSAFLSAARAVTWALQHEQKDRYDAWFPSWLNKRGEEDQAFLKAMIEHRNFVQKRGGAELNQEWEDIPVTEIRMDNRAHPAYGFHWFGPPGTPAPTVGMPVYSFKGSGDDVISACQLYLQLLDNLVGEFIEDHK